MSSTEITLQNINKRGCLNCFVSTRDSLALKEARAVDCQLQSGDWKGPLHGVPVAVKDNIFLAGEVASCGMPILRDKKWDETAKVVKSLQSAGAIIVGKASLTEAATFFHSEEFSTPVNPVNADLWPGASSSGSAVSVASGLVYASLGTDTGGSIRHPAACNGILGVKPTRGLLSNSGVFPHAPSFDHVGFFTRDAESARAFLNVLSERSAFSGSLGGDLLGQSLRERLADFKIGIDWDYIGADVDKDTRNTIERILEFLRESGSRVVEQSFPYRPSILRHAINHILVETAFVHKRWFPKQRDRYGKCVASNLDTGDAVSRADLLEALVAERNYFDDVAEYFSEVDVLVTPIFPTSVPTWTDFATIIEADITAWSKYTLPFNVTGSPSVTVPCGRTATGVPIAIQLVGRQHADWKLLNFCELLEASGLLSVNAVPQQHYPD